MPTVAAIVGGVLGQEMIKVAIIIIIIIVILYFHYYSEIHYYYYVYLGNLTERSTIKEHIRVQHTGHHWYCCASAS